MSDDLNAGFGELEWDAVTDGTTTRVRLYDEGGKILGEGVSKRCKGDPRNQDLGVAIASARAFEQAADYCYKQAGKLGYGYGELSFTLEEANQIRSLLKRVLSTFSFKREK